MLPKYYDLISKSIIVIKSFLRHELSQPELYGYFVYK